MDPSDVIQIINNTGFPIAAACALFYLCNTTVKNNTDTLQEVCKTLSVLVERMEASRHE